MKLLVQVPSTWVGERRYIWSVLLDEVLGLTFDLQTADVAETTISMPGMDGAVTMPEGFFAMPAEDWLTPKSMPVRPLARLQAPGNVGLPDGMPLNTVAIYGAIPVCDAACTLTDTGARINFDLAGSAFFMLTRYEEAVAGDRDVHDRFPASAALAFDERFLDRPVVNEYVELLFACLRHCWPNLQRRVRAYRVLVSHDVDSALFNLGCTTSRMLRALAGDLVQRRDLALAARRTRSFFAARRGHHNPDPHNTFDYLMDFSEKHSLRSAFYFIAGGNSRYDANYTMDMPWIQGLVRKIGARGHEVGLHSGYDTYLDPKQTAAQFRTLRECTDRNGIRQNRWGGRQHYLRWRAGTTWANWVDAGLDYDSSVGFAETTGFRAGCCHEYPVYDVVARTALPLRERPLVLMETTLIAPSYMNLRPAERLDEARKLATTCRRHGGDMTLLWHNSKVTSRSEREEYEAILEIALHAA